jgi:hypothetical protein
MASIEMLVAVVIFIKLLANYVEHYSLIENVMMGISVAGLNFRMAIIFFASYAIFKLLSNTAKTALYKRTLLEEQYCFVDIENSNKSPENYNLFIGQIVMNRYTGERLKITKITHDGKYSCEREDGTFVGDFLLTALDKV